MPLCTPGAQIACACPGSTVPGAQVCKADGSGLGPCTGCPAGAGGGGTGGTAGASGGGGAAGSGGAGGDPNFTPMKDTDYFVCQQSEISKKHCNMYPSTPTCITWKTDATNGQQTLVWAKAHCKFIMTLMVTTDATACCPIP